MLASHHSLLLQMHPVPPLRRVIARLTHLSKVGSVFMAILAWAAPNTALPKTTRELTMGGIPTLATSGFQVAKPKSFAWWLLWLIILLESLHPPPIRVWCCTLDCLPSWPATPFLMTS